MSLSPNVESQEPENIVVDYLYVTDGRDFALTLLSAQSVREHVPNARFHLITAGDWIPPSNSPITWVSVFSISIDELKNFVHYQVEGSGAEFHWGWGACARWFVQQMTHLHHCIYLDSDILCLRPPRLKEAKTVAAVPSQNFNKVRHNETADFASKLFNKEMPLFETGVLVLNVDWMRKVDFLSKIFNAATEIQQTLGKRFFAENCLLSRNFSGLIEKLPLAYNAGDNDVNYGLISEKETIFYHFHHEASGLQNKEAVMSAYARRGTRLNIAYAVDDSAEQIARMWMSMRTVRQWNKAVRFYVISTRPLRGKFINLVCPVPKDGFEIFRDHPHTRFADGTMLRFYLPRLPIGRVIYLDTDTNCHGSLETLWEMTMRKGIGAFHYTIPDTEPYAELKRMVYGKTYTNAGVLALNLDYLRSVSFETESLAWTALAGIPTEAFFAGETILNLRWKTILYPIPRKYNVRFDRAGQKAKAIRHFCARQKEAQVQDFAFRALAQKPKKSMHARIELLQMELEWLKKTIRL